MDIAGARGNVDNQKLLVIISEVVHTFQLVDAYNFIRVYQWTANGTTYSYSVNEEKAFRGVGNLSTEEVVDLLIDSVFTELHRG